MLEDFLLKLSANIIIDHILYSFNLLAAFCRVLTEDCKSRYKTVLRLEVIRWRNASRWWWWILGVYVTVARPSDAKEDVNDDDDDEGESKVPEQGDLLDCVQ